MSAYDYLIVGSGLTGAVFANEAVKRGKRCLVLERRKHIGGNLHCEMIQDIWVHRYGAHIFHTSNQRVWEYLNQIATFNHFINSPLANYRGEIYNLPFNMNTFYRLWGTSTPAEALQIIEQQRGSVNFAPRNLEEQAIAMVGKDIYHKLIKGYTEKQWGKDCRELPASIIKRLPVRYTYDNNYFNDAYQGIPIDGYNPIIDRLLEGSEVLCDTDYLNNREKFNCMATKVFYTGMLDEFYQFRFGELEYRSLRFEDEILEQENFQGVAVVNYTDRETPYTRIIEHKHFAFQKGKRTVITREYPAGWTVGREAYYPVNDEKNRALYRRYKALADEQEDVIFCGRLAQYQYFDMDDAIENALDVALKELSDI